MSLTSQCHWYRGSHANTIPQNAIFILGNFDGVHLGHQYLIELAKLEKPKTGNPIIVLSFEPQPQEFFQKESPARLTCALEKYLCLKALGVDGFWTFQFNQLFSKQKALDFIQNQIAPAHPHLLIVGDDFRFGYQREGDIQLLKNLGEQFHFQVQAVLKKQWQDQPISSTRIRQALAQGDFSSAEQLLGRPYSMMGRIIHGNALGRTLGFPTINIPIKRKVPALKGVFVVSVVGLESYPVQGIANLGTRPVISGEYFLLEVHLLNFSRMVYGRRVQVFFHQKCRDELHFENLEQLKIAMQNDKDMAIDYFKRAQI